MRLRLLELARGRETPHRPSRPAWPGTFCCYLMLHSPGHRDVHGVNADSLPPNSVCMRMCVCGHWLLAFLSLQPPDQCTTSQPGTQKFSQTFLLPTPTHRRLQILCSNRPDTLMPGEVGKRLLSRRPSHLPNGTMMLSTLDGDGCLMPCRETLGCPHLVFPRPRPCLSQKVAAVTGWEQEETTRDGSGRVGLGGQEALGGGILQMPGSKYPAYVPLLHQVTKCKFKDKTIKNFKTTRAKH